MSEILERAKAEIFMNATELGFHKEIAITMKSRDEEQLRANLQRLMSMCLRDKSHLFTDEAYYELEPEFNVQTPDGVLKIGYNSKLPCHVTWKNLCGLMNKNNENHTKGIIQVLLQFNGEMLKSEEITENNLNSPEDMLEYMCKIYQIKKENYF